MGLEVLAIAALAGGVYSANEQRQATDKARRQNRKAAAADAKIQEMKAARERRSQIRQARIAQANLEAGAAATGTARTSSAAQGIGSVQTRTASNISFLDSVGSLTETQNIFRSKAASSASRAATAGAKADLSMSIFSQAGGFGTLFGEGQ